jgi:hypothetical protein
MVAIEVVSEVVIEAAIAADHPSSNQSREI